jgi:hypothetical protein
MTAATVMTLAERIAEERIQKSQSQPINVRQMAKKPERFNFTLTIQRNLRWTMEQKSGLIESILLGYPIPAVYTVKSLDNVLWFLDGKQRGDTLISYRNDGFALSEMTVYGVNITGMKYSDLPEEFKELIDEQNITIYQFEKLTTEQRDIMFKKLNSGTPLSTIELIRSILGTDLLEYFDTLILTDFFQKVAMTVKQRDKFIDQELILQSIALLTGRSKNISGNALRDLALSLRIDGLKDEEKTIIESTFQYLSTGFDVISEKQAKKALKKADTLALIMSAKDCEVEPEVFANLLVPFIEAQSSDSEYGMTKKSGGAKPNQVKKRVDILNAVLSGEIVLEVEVVDQEEKEKPLFSDEIPTDDLKEVV